MSPERSLCPLRVSTWVLTLTRPATTRCLASPPVAAKTRGLHELPQSDREGDGHRRGRVPLRARGRPAVSSQSLSRMGITK